MAGKDKERSSLQNSRMRKQVSKNYSCYVLRAICKTQLRAIFLLIREKNKTFTQSLSSCNLIAINRCIDVDSNCVICVIVSLSLSERVLDSEFVTTSFKARVVYAIQIRTGGFIVRK